MARAYSRTLLKEDWSSLPTGSLHRDNTARGEYMAMTVPSNPGGWYHNANAGAGADQDHSPFVVRSRRGGRTVGLPPRSTSAEWVWCSPAASGLGGISKSRPW